MHQQQGCLLYDFNLGQPFFKSVREPLYLNYRCEARQVIGLQQIQIPGSWVLLEEPP